MALTKWEPMAGLTGLRREMERLWEDFFDGGRLQARTFGDLEPAVEVSDTPDTVMVKAQVPGMNKDQIQLQITDDMLTIKGEVREEEKKEEKNYYRQEFRYGAFSRTIPLPAAVQAEKAEAQLKDGVLQITIPKSEQTKAKAIPIQS
jgi:HSP20 family protein